MQLAAEAAAAATHFGNTSPASNSQPQYVIATPSGVHPNGFPRSYCAWHSSASTTAGTIDYTNLPYVPDLGAAGCTTLTNPGPLDGYFSTETHEYAETVTDLWPSQGWLTGNVAEIGDLCVSLDSQLRLPVPAGSQTYVNFDVQGLESLSCSNSPSNRQMAGRR
jgi:hypothetical protein